MIPRKISPVLLRSAQLFPVLTLLGPRQSGKTTLVRYENKIRLDFRIASNASSRPEASFC
jgi:predicted AAA+ superfamily ATPase